MPRRALFSPPILISLIVVLLASTLPLYVSGYVLGLLTVAYYFGVFSMAWDLLFGFANEVNFGPSFLIGLGAYTAGILDNLYQPPIVLMRRGRRARGDDRRRRAGVAGAEGARALFRPHHPCRGAHAAELRRRGGEPHGRGDRPHRAGRHFDRRQGQLLDRARLHGRERRHPLRAFALAVGLILQASGQDPVQAGALGFNVTKHKLAAFLVSAFFSGLAGALMVFYLGAASVGTFIDVTVGVQVIVGAVLGGRRTILGGVLGAVFLVAFGETLRPLGDLATFIVSAVALIVVLFFPGGLIGMVKGAREAA